MEATPEDQHSHHGHQDNPNAFRSMRDRMHPPRMSAPSCIVPPTEQLVIRPHIVPLLPTFHGMESENPYAHIKEFEDAKEYPTWTDLQAEFLKKFFPTHRTNGLKRQISNFSAKENEKFYECWKDTWKPSMLVLTMVLIHGYWLTKLNIVQEKGRFPSQPHQNPKGIHEVETHEGESSQEEEEKREEGGNQRKEERYSEGKEDHDSTVNANPEKDLLRRCDEENTPPPFPQALHGKKGIRNASEILEVLRQVKVNIPLLDMIKQVPTYAKFLKDLCTIKRGLNVNKKAFLTEQVVEKALLDLGASVNLLPYSVYKQLGLGELKPTSITLSLADRSVKIPRGIIEDVLVQVDNFYYPEWTHATHFGNMTLGSISLYVKKLITPEEEEGPEEVCIIDTLVEEHCWRRREEILPLFNKEEAQEAAKEETPKLNLKPLPMELKYTYLEEINNALLLYLHLLLSSGDVLLEVLKRSKPIRQPQRRLNPHLQEVVRAEVLKLLQAGIIYPISDSPWVSPTQVVPKKSGITVVQNEKGEEIATRLTSGWRVCIDYRKLNVVTRKDHFPLPFIDQVLERVSGHPFYCFLDGYSGYFQIEIDVEDQEKTTFTCPFGTYAYRRMPFGLCNAPATFQRCMLSIFSDMVERIMEVFMDDITIYGGTFEECLVNLEAVLNRCIEKDLVLNWEKCHFMVHQGIVLGHIISEKGIEVDKAKVELIVKLPSPTTVKGVRQFLGHAGFYRRFIKDFSKLSKPLCELLAKDAKFMG
ncbi:Retrovirus-related Pol polyprotein from transposon 17.6 [Vitis vinifera]|uniref:Retrovirus-related Pol polyprotein from transposon 17.6 n=1 Tax=Vitis vinifera TaxID=29760 RepID=A0A438HC38_VITVI|nr:Retrovirus-related Pol polyprotein from transposon 17.6 [Vitis vinifera]